MAPINGTSRVTSAHTSRANSVAREIIKKRDKPFKTEQHRVLTKKRKLDIHTAYGKSRKDLPRGYSFLPVGTPDLAHRCRELSRQHGVPMFVVNNRPHNRNAANPRHVSHHIARIGYQFRSDLLDIASHELGYVYSGGHFMKYSEAESKEVTEEKRSLWAGTLAKYGLSADLLPRETHDQVRAAIKELFPKIPDQDLRDIVQHAWEEGSKRIGNAQGMDLARRAQLATIARIRHCFTDYDRLLKAFDWKEARSMVEPECLAKLIEWRGEVDDGQDDGLEEIVTEAIVIDDDDDVHASEADDEDSPAEGDIDIVEHAGDTDFDAETLDEGARRRFVDRHRPTEDMREQRRLLAKQKIDATRQRMRGYGPPLRQVQNIPSPPPLPQSKDLPPQPPPPLQYPHSQAPPAAIEVRPDAHGKWPDMIITADGRRLRLANVPQPPPQQYLDVPPPPPPPPNYAHHQNHYGSSPAAGLAPAPYDPANPPSIYDQPIQSIERDDNHAYSTPPQLMRQHTNWSHPQPSYNPSPYGATYYQHPNNTPTTNSWHSLPNAQVINLVSPPRRGRGTRESPELLDRIEYPQAYHRPAALFLPIHGAPAPVQQAPPPQGQQYYHGR